MCTALFASFCRESMRMMPVSADGTFRVSATDLKVGPHTIPAGTQASPTAPIIGQSQR